MRIKSLNIILILLSLYLVSCDTRQDQQQPSVLSVQSRGEDSYGAIIATLGAWDEETRSIYYKGYYIKIDNDTLLSFYMDLDQFDLTDISVPYGKTVLYHPINIPYALSCTVLSADDKRFIRYAPVIQDAMRQDFSTVKIKQAVITRKE